MYNKIVSVDFTGMIPEVKEELSKLAKEVNMDKTELKELHQKAFGEFPTIVILFLSNIAGWNI